MKIKINLLTLALFLSLSNFLIAQGSLTGIFPNNGTSGQTFSVSLTGTNTNFVLATGASIYSGQSNYVSSSFFATSPTTATASFSIPPSANPGVYNVGYYVNGTIAGSLNNSFTLSPGPGANFSQISGKIVADNNADCFLNGTDNPEAGVIIQTNPGNFSAISDSNGNYSIWVPNGNYDVSCSPSPFYTFLCPVNNIHAVSFPATGVYYDTQNDFFMDTISAMDVSIFMSQPFFRPGFTQSITVTVSTDGYIPANNVVAEVILDSNLVFQSSSLAPTSVNGYAYTWNLGTINPPQNRVITINTLVPIPTPINTPISNQASVNTTTTELNTGNNTSAYDAIVTGSYDPNDKRAFNAAGTNLDGFFEASDEFLYYIRFQNTGNDTAFNIIVRDTLDSQLDISTFNILQYSHPVIPSITGESAFAFLFPNILLPDSNRNEPLSHGFIRFSVKPIAGLGNGATIENTAHIYFDYNAPIVTNTVVSILCPVIGAGFNFTQNQSTVDFTDQSSGLVDNITWDFGDGNTSTSTSPSHTYAAPGTYFVCQYVSNGCGRVDSLCTPISVMTTGLTETPYSHLSVSPNPSEGVFYVNATLKKKSVVVISATDLHGRMLTSHSLPNATGSFTHGLDLKKQPAGIYFLNIQIGDQLVHQKVVKK